MGKTYIFSPLLLKPGGGGTSPGEGGSNEAPESTTASFNTDFTTPVYEEDANVVTPTEAPAAPTVESSGGGDSAAEATTAQ